MKQRNFGKNIIEEPMPCYKYFCFFSFSNIFKINDLSFTSHTHISLNNIEIKFKRFQSVCRVGCPFVDNFSPFLQFSFYFIVKI